ncbi:hypothetical protein ONZ51_g12774 [Trametes cubensis]|uniref:Uncharacterized protein n=1 Tax=Trametes cubensis TaxID=1111947 RepID=A0AAD7TF66_9APHY|nr:hypothetical protein ONZ51_g12774 [Trametes cubensis]
MRRAYFRLVIPHSLRRSRPVTQRVVRVILDPGSRPQTAASVNGKVTLRLQALTKPRGHERTPAIVAEAQEEARSPPRVPRARPQANTSARAALKVLHQPPFNIQILHGSAITALRPTTQCTVFCGLRPREDDAHAYYSHAIKAFAVDSTIRVLNVHVGVPWSERNDTIACGLYNQWVQMSLRNHHRDLSYDKFVDARHGMIYSYPGKKHRFPGPQQLPRYRAWNQAQGSVRFKVYGAGEPARLIPDIALKPYEVHIADFDIIDILNV